MRMHVIGGGFMGSAMVRQALARGIVQPSSVLISEINPDRRAELQAELGVAVTDGYRDIAAQSELLLLATKPQEFASVAQGLAGMLAPHQLVVSVMAGTRAAAIREGTGAAVVRVMPNLAVSVGEAFSLWLALPEVSDEQKALVRALLTACGREQEVADEKLMDAATAVAGSGPGFVMLIAEALIDGAVAVGLRPELAREMVLQTLLGSAAWARDAGRHPGELRGQVTSAAGTTIAGLMAMERRGVRAGLAEGVIAAYERSRELSGA